MKTLQTGDEVLSKILLQFLRIAQIPTITLRHIQSATFDPATITCQRWSAAGNECMDMRVNGARGTFDNNTLRHDGDLTRKEAQPEPSLSHGATDRTE